MPKRFSMNLSKDGYLDPEMMSTNPLHKKSISELSTSEIIDELINRHEITQYHIKWGEEFRIPFRGKERACIYGAATVLVRQLQE
jgi:hypothetical protein